MVLGIKMPGNFLIQRSRKPHVKITRVQNFLGLKIMEYGRLARIIGQFGIMKCCAAAQLTFICKMCRTSWAEAPADGMTEQRWTGSHLKCKWKEFEFGLIQKHYRYFIASVPDYSFSMYTPSIIAAASIAAALDGLEWTVKSGYSLSQLLDTLHIITAIERVSYGSIGFSSEY